jgi:hypothetical protein
MYGDFCILSLPHTCYPSWHEIRELIAKLIANRSEGLGSEKRPMRKNWELLPIADACWGRKMRFLAVC